MIAVPDDRTRFGASLCEWPGSIAWPVIPGEAGTLMLALQLQFEESEYWASRADARASATASHEARHTRARILPLWAQTPRSSRLSAARRRDDLVRCLGTLDACRSAGGRSGPVGGAGAAGTRGNPGGEDFRFDRSSVAKGAMCDLSSRNGRRCRDIPAFIGLCRRPKPRIKLSLSLETHMSPRRVIVLRSFVPGVERRAAPWASLSIDRAWSND
jgi:hypothetical protein